MAEVLRIADSGTQALQSLLSPYGLSLELSAPDQAILGSFWGDEEAGLVGNQLIVRADTPIHSALHEAAHYVCMDQQRRDGLHTDAGGDYDEENGVCYLQILWAAELADMGQQRMFKDMDTWGYCFRLGSAQAWYEGDADDARQWLEDHGIIQGGRLTWALRK